MYVAITRARQRLHLSFSQTRMLHGQTRYHAKSRFLDELPEGALKWLTPRHGGFGGSGGFGGYGGRGPMGGGTGGMGGRGAAWSPAPPPSWSAPVPAPMARQAAASAGHGLRQGLRVFHNKFGEGVVLALEGAGADARAQVSFGRHGTKWLALAVARLTPIDD